MDIINSEALVDIFGEWPSFHDAEIYAVRLDSGQRTDRVPRLELDIHLFEAGGRRPDGRTDWVKHTLATLEFEGVEEVELLDFGHQNVIFEFDLKDIDVAGERMIEVDLPGSNGLSASFRCRSVTVLAAVPFEPGEHSAYGPR